MCVRFVLLLADYQGQPFCRLSIWNVHDFLNDHHCLSRPTAHIYNCKCFLIRLKSCSKANSAIQTVSSLEIATYTKFLNITPRLFATAYTPVSIWDFFFNLLFCSVVTKSMQEKLRNHRIYRRIYRIYIFGLWSKRAGAVHIRSKICSENTRIILGIVPRLQVTTVLASHLLLPLVLCRKTIVKANSPTTCQESYSAFPGHRIACFGTQSWVGRS